MMLQLLDYCASRSPSLAATLVPSVSSIRSAFSSSTSATLTSAAAASGRAYSLISQPSTSNFALDPSITRSFSSSSDQSSMPVDWDWAFVAGAKPGRKPSIKRPKRHQWYFCNPNYDPSASVHDGAHRMIPHAPAHASLKDDWDAFHRTKPAEGVSYSKHRRAFNRYLQLRDLDWKYAFEDGLAQYVKVEQKKLRTEEEARRQQAWRDYKHRLFQTMLVPEDAVAEKLELAETAEKAEKAEK